jgi:uncharacterized membrane protein YeiH
MQTRLCVRSVVGAQKATDFHLGIVAAVLIAVIGTTGGRFIIDIACGLPPKQLVRGEFFVLNPVLTALLYLGCRDLAHLPIAAATAIGVLFGFGFRILAQVYGWEELSLGSLLRNEPARSSAEPWSNQSAKRLPATPRSRRRGRSR